MRYIFAGITVLFFILLVPVVVGHTKFAKSPDTVLELIDETNVFNRCDNVIIRLKDIDEIQVKLNTNKYGHPYSYGTLKLVTGSKVYVMKRVHRPDEVKNSLLALKKTHGNCCQPVLRLQNFTKLDRDITKRPKRPASTVFWWSGNKQIRTVLRKCISAQNTRAPGFFRPISQPFRLQSEWLCRKEPPHTERRA